MDLIEQTARDKSKKEVEDKNTELNDATKSRKELDKIIMLDDFFKLNGVGLRNDILKQFNLPFRPLKTLFESDKKDEL